MYQMKFKMLSKPRVRACKLVLAVVLMALPGCASTVKYVREKPPVELLADCPAVVERVKTNGQLVETILDYRASMTTCNTDKESLRKWSEGSYATQAKRNG